MRRIALVGASGSGKTWLASRLAQAFAARGENIQINDGALLAGRVLPQDSVLLMGLDLRQPSPAQTLEDQALRQALADCQQAFQVIYGQGESRLASALQALKVASTNAVHAEPESTQSAERPAKRKPWVWACEKCSDPVCEHRLLSDLLAKR